MDDLIVAKFFKETLIALWFTLSTVDYVKNSKRMEYCHLQKIHEYAYENEMKLNSIKPKIITFNLTINFY